MPAPFKRVPAAISLVLGLTVAACAELPDTGARTEIKPITAYRSESRFSAPEIAWPDRQWWTRYGDPQLNGLIDEALSGSPDSAAALARLRSAEAAAQITGASLWPSLQAETSFFETKQSYNYGIPPAFTPHGFQDADTLTLNLSYELDLWGKNRAATAAALSEAEAARLDAAMVGVTLSAAVADAYADLARLYAERDVAQSALDLRQATFELTAKRLRSGLDTRAELKQAESGVPAAREALLAIDESIELDRNRLSALLGAGPDRGRTIARPGAGATKPFGLPAHLSLDLLGRRADIQAARLRAEAEAKRIDVAEAAFYPNVDLVAFIGGQALGLNNLIRPGSDIGAIGPAITLPIFTGHQLQGQYRRAEADYRAAVANYDQTVTTALREVADVTASGKALTGRIEASRQAVADSDEAYRIARRRYDGGLSNFLSVLSAEDALLTNRRVLADLEARAFTLDIALFRALGGGFGS